MAKRKKAASGASKKPGCQPGDVMAGDCWQLYLVASIRKGADCSNRVVFDLSDRLADLPKGLFRKPSKSKKK